MDGGPYLRVSRALFLFSEKKGNPRDGRLQLDAARPVAKKNLASRRTRAAGHCVQWVSTADLCSPVCLITGRMYPPILPLVFYFFSLIMRARRRCTAATVRLVPTGLHTG